MYVHLLEKHRHKTLQIQTHIQRKPRAVLSCKKRNKKTKHVGKQIPKHKRNPLRVCRQKHPHAQSMWAFCWHTRRRFACTHGGALDLSPNHTYHAYHASHDDHHITILKNFAADNSTRMPPTISVNHCPWHTNHQPKWPRIRSYYSPTPTFSPHAHAC